MVNTLRAAIALLLFVSSAAAQYPTRPGGPVPYWSTSIPCKPDGTAECSFPAVTSGTANTSQWLWARTSVNRAGQVPGNPQAGDVVSFSTAAYASAALGEPALTGNVPTWFIINELPFTGAQANACPAELSTLIGSIIPGAAGRIGAAHVLTPFWPSPYLTSNTIMVNPQTQWPPSPSTGLVVEYSFDLPVTAAMVGSGRLWGVQAMRWDGTLYHLSGVVYVRF